MARKLCDSIEVITHMPNINIPVMEIVIIRMGSKDWTLYFIPLFVIILVEFIWPMLVYNKKKTLREKFEADEIAESIPRSKTILGRMQSFLGPIGYATIIIFFLLGKMSYDAGKAKALTQVKYYVLDDLTNTLAIRVYKDILICVKYNNVKKIINTSIILKKIDGNQPIELSLKEVGPLSFKEEKDLINKSITVENDTTIKYFSKDSITK